MLSLKAPGYSRAFYIVAVTAWTAAVALMFITAVWGGFQGLMNKLVTIEESRQTPQPRPAQALQENPAFGRLAPNPFTDSQPAPEQAPTGWVVQETIRGGTDLQARDDKLFSKEPAQQPKTRPESRAEPRAPEKPQPAAAESGGVIRSLKCEPSQDTFLLSVVASATPENVGFFFLDKPRRLAVNIKGVWRNAAPRVTEFATGPIAKLNIGEHPDYVRITLLFRDPDAPKHRDPVITKVKDGLQVSLTTK